MKREFLLPVLAAAVLVAFAAVSLLVWASRGRSGRLVRRKLALGALLIGLTAVATGCDDDGPRPTCYVPVIENQIAVTGDTGSGLVVDLAQSTTVEGTIYYRAGTTFSFAVVRIAGDLPTLAQSGDLAAADGAFDEPDEAFALQLDAGLAAGDYQLRFYTVPAAAVTAQTPAHTTVTLQIITGGR